MGNKPNLFFKRTLRFIKTDRAILVLSISIALFFWFFTKMSKNYETEREVDIQYELPEGKTFLNHPPQTIKANIKGGGWNLFFYWLSGSVLSINFPLDNTDTQFISSTNIVNKLSATIGTKYEVLNVESDIITIKLDNDSTRQIPVVLDVDLRMKNGFMQADSLRIEPDFFTVSGPQSIVENLTFYPTEKVIIEEVSGDFSQKIKAKTPLNSQLKIKPEEVVITNKVERYTEGELVVPIKILNATDSISILPKNVFIKYRAALSVFSRITVEDFSVVARLDETNLKRGNNTLALELVRQPAFTKVVTMNPPTIEYYVIQ